MDKKHPPHTPHSRRPALHRALDSGTPELHRQFLVQPINTRRGNRVMRVRNQTTLDTLFLARDRRTGQTVISHAQWQAGCEMLRLMVEVAGLSRGMSIDYARPRVDGGSGKEGAEAALGRRDKFDRVWRWLTPPERHALFLLLVDDLPVRHLCRAMGCRHDKTMRLVVGALQRLAVRWGFALGRF